MTGANTSILSGAIDLEHEVKLAISADREVARALIAESITGALLGEAPMFGDHIPAQRRTTVYGVEPGTQALITRMHRKAVEDSVLTFASPAPDAMPRDCIGTEARAVFCATTAAAVVSMDAVLICLPPFPMKASVPTESISQFVAAAKLRARTVIMLMVGLPDQATSMLPYIFDDVLEASGCEPDDGFSSAYMLRPAPGSVSEAIAWKPTIVNSRFTPDRVERLMAAGTAKDFATREIIRHADAGKSLSFIGNKLGLHKSTIKRRLDALPFNPKRKLALDD